MRSSEKGSNLMACRPTKHIVPIFFGFYALFILLPAIGLMFWKQPQPYSVAFGLAPYETSLIIFDTLWYKGVNVETDQPQNMHVYRLPSNPDVRNRTVEEYSAKPIELPAEEENFWEYYLSKNSLVQIHYALSNNVTFAIIQGADNIHKWLEDKNHAEGVKKHILTTSKGKIDFKTTAKDMYYFVWFNYMIDTNVTGRAWFTVTTATHVLDGYLDMCQKESLCEVEVGKSSGETVILEGVNPSELPNVNITGTYTILPRTVYYWSVFGSILAALAALGLLIIVALFFTQWILVQQRKSRHPHHSYQQGDRRNVNYTQLAVGDDLVPKSFGKDENNNENTNNQNNDEESKQEIINGNDEQWQKHEQQQQHISSDTPIAVNTSNSFSNGGPGSSKTPRKTRRNEPVIVDSN